MTPGWTTLVVFTVFTSFIVYATGGVSTRTTFGPHLSPLYSPVFFASPGDTAGLAHAWFGAQPAWWPSLIPFSPALLILPFPGVFRVTCYYYRGAYYKAFWADPLACSVGEPARATSGENSFPLILQNIHRYAFYIAVLFIFVLSHGSVRELCFRSGTPASASPASAGTLAPAVNVVLLASTFGCHSDATCSAATWTKCRSPRQERLGDCVTGLNKRHAVRVTSFSRSHSPTSTSSALLDGDSVRLETLDGRPRLA